MNARVNTLWGNFDQCKSSFRKYLLYKAFLPPYHGFTISSPLLETYYMREQLVGLCTRLFVLVKPKSYLIKIVFPPSLTQVAPETHLYFMRMLVFLQLLISKRHCLNLIVLISMQHYVKPWKANIQV